MDDMNSITMYSLVMILIFIAILGIIRYLSPIVHTVIAGDVKTENRKNKTIRLGITANFMHENKVINPNDFYIGKVDGNSMSLEGLFDGQIFFADKKYEPAKKGEIFVLKTPEGQANSGVLKLRKIVNINEKTGNLLTKSCDLESIYKKPSEHHKEDLIARVCFIPEAA